jgi:hypothetical protein
VLKDYQLTPNGSRLRDSLFTAEMVVSLYAERSEPSLCLLTDAKPSFLHLLTDGWQLLTALNRLLNYGPASSDRRTSITSTYADLVGG